MDAFSALALKDHEIAGVDERHPRNIDEKNENFKTSARSRSMLCASNMYRWNAPVSLFWNVSYSGRATYRYVVKWKTEKKLVASHLVA